MIDVIRPNQGEGTGDLRPVTMTLWRPKSFLHWVDHFLSGRGRYPEATKALIVADAEELINRLGASSAYAEAVARSSPNVIDDSRPEGHWSHVRRAIADHAGIKIGASGWKGS
jgi:hypothetical protein